MNKRGQFFMIYLVLITIFMIGIVIGFYYLQNTQYQKTASSLVSPMEVMEIRDDKILFELKEEEYILSALEEAEGKFDSLEFKSSFRNSFLSKVGNDVLMKEFITRDLIFQGRKVESEAASQFEDFISNSVYPESLIVFENGKMVLERSDIEKNKLLLAKENNKINFPIVFNYNFKKKYLISFEDGKYEVIDG